MHVYSARVELDLPSRTLKEKRQIIRSLLKRARQVFNVAAAEVDLNDAVGSASLGFGPDDGFLDRAYPYVLR